MPPQSKDGNGVINEDMASFDELLNKLVDTDEVYPEEQEGLSCACLRHPTSPFNRRVPHARRAPSSFRAIWGA